MTALAGTDEIAPSVRSLQRCQDRVDRLVATFLNHRILTHLLRQLTAANLDLSTLGVSASIWHRCSTSTVVPALPVADGRITLDLIAGALDEHRALERRTISSLAAELPGSFMVMFGQGIALAHPGYSERFSHDIDLLVGRPSDGEAVVSALCDRGFVATEARSGSFRGVPFCDWTLDAPDIGGHAIHVDISTGSITRTDSWMRPLVLPDLFYTANSVTLAERANQSVLVPSDTHQLLMLAEKAQRTHRYDARVRCDSVVLVRDGLVDLGETRETGERIDLMSSLRWMLGERRSVLSRRRGPRDFVSEGLIAAMAFGTNHPSEKDPQQWQHRPSLLHGIAARAFRKLVR